MDSPAQSDPEPSERELLAMAFADGELSGARLAEFQRRLLAEPELAREVSELVKLDLLARQQAPPEPIDAEWARLAAEPRQRLLNRFGTLLFFGGATLFSLGYLLAAFTGRALLIRPGLFCLSLGFLLLLWAGIRQRLRELPYDPYVHVKR
jgi:anti-sigma factor RsiW